MIEFCQLQIVFIFNNRGSDKNVNESVSMELQQMMDMDKKYVKIFYENGSLEQTKQLLRGLLQRQKRIWPQDSFNRDSEMQSIYKSCFTFCYDKIISDPTIIYNFENMNDYKNIISQFCKEVMK